MNAAPLTIGIRQGQVRVEQGKRIILIAFIEANPDAISAAVGALVEAELRAALTYQGETDRKDGST